MPFVQYATLTRSEIPGMILGIKSNRRKLKERLLQRPENEESIELLEMKAAGWF